MGTGTGSPANTQYLVTAGELVWQHCADIVSIKKIHQKGKQYRYAH